MRRKISIIGEDGRLTFSLLARADACELTLVAPGALESADEVAADVAREGSRRRVRGSEQLEAVAGSVVVVLARVMDVAELGTLARIAPDAVLVVAAGDVAQQCDRALRATTFARPRVVGAASAAGPAEAAAELAFAVLLDRGHVLRCVARCQGEGGLEGTRAVRARVGAGGVSEILGA